MATPRESDSVISVRHLGKAYGSTIAVTDVSFDVAPGEIFGILGPNGAGKTTTVEILQGLRSRDGGTVSVLGLDPRTDAAALKRRIGSQLQESALPDRIRVWEALDLFASLTPGSVDYRSVMEEWGLADRAQASFGSLSGGQRQRLFVALALVNEPELVFLDEMTTGLDPAGRRVAWDLVRRIRDRGATVVLVTHFMDEAEALCDRVAVIAAGRVIALDTPGALIATHGGPARIGFTTALPDLGWIETIPGVVSVSRRGGVAEVIGIGGVLARVAAGLAERGEAPEDLSVVTADLEDVYLRLVGGDGG
jgi:ABC-2 type transport system ATP-binding protein